MHCQTKENRTTMATSNFCYQNRCVIVTDDDYEFENIPECEDNECLPYNSSFPSKLIKRFEFWDVVLTSGYYQDACIDYVERDDIWDVITGYIGYPCSKKELFAELKDAFGISKRMAQKICGNVGTLDIDDYVEQAKDKIKDYLAEREEHEVNAYIDKLKEEYGYRECTCIGRASNGEAFYQMVGE